MASTPEMPAPAGPPKTFIPPIGIGHSKPKLASPPPAPDVSQSSAAKQGGLGKAKGSAEVFDISGGGPKAASHGTAPGQPKSSSAPRAPMDDGDSGEDSEEEEHEKDEICDPLALEPVEEQEKKGRKKPRRIWQLYLTCCFLMGLTVFISMISSGASDGWFTFMAVLSSFPPFLMVIAWARVGSDSKYMPFVIGLPALLFGAYLVYKATADNDPGLAVLMNHILALTIGSTMTVTIDVETLAIPDSRHLTSFFFTTIGHAMISGGARINLDPRVIIMHSFCMFRLIFPDSLRTAITDNKLVHIAVLGLMHYISAESLLTGLGVIRAPFRGENLARPSGYTSLGSFRGKISTQLTVGTAIKDVKMKEGDGVFKFLRASASALTSLPTGSKVRAEMLEGSYTGAFVISFLSAAISRSGKLSMISPQGSTRASENLFPSVAFSRALLNETGLGLKFNGVGTSVPEVSLLRYSEDGTTTPGLLGLLMSDRMRGQLQADLSQGLGVGSYSNPAITRAQRERVPQLSSHLDLQRLPSHCVGDRTSRTSCHGH